MDFVCCLNFTKINLECEPNVKQINSQPNTLEFGKDCWSKKKNPSIGCTFILSSLGWRS